MASSSKRRFVKKAQFDGHDDAAKIQGELRRLAHAGYRVPVAFSGSETLDAYKLNYLAGEVSRAIGKRVAVAFDETDAPAGLNRLFQEVERILR